MTQHPPDPRYPPPGYGAPVGYRPPLSPSEQRTWATLAHLAPFAGLLVGLAFVGSLVIYLMYKDRGPFVRRHSAAALNFQVWLLIVMAAVFVLAAVVGIATLGTGLILFIPVIIGIAAAAVIAQILGAVAANRGQEFRYPLTPTMIT